MPINAAELIEKLTSQTKKCEAPINDEFFILIQPLSEKILTDQTLRHIQNGILLINEAFKQYSLSISNEVSALAKEARALADQVYEPSQILTEQEKIRLTNLRVEYRSKLTQYFYKQEELIKIKALFNLDRIQMGIEKLPKELQNRKAMELHVEHLTASQLVLLSEMVAFVDKDLDACLPHLNDKASLYPISFDLKALKLGLAERMKRIVEAGNIPHAMAQLSKSTLESSLLKSGIAEIPNHPQDQTIGQAMPTLASNETEFKCVEAYFLNFIYHSSTENKIWAEKQNLELAKEKTYVDQFKDSLNQYLVQPSKMLLNNLNRYGRFLNQSASSQPETAVSLESDLIPDETEAMLRELNAIIQDNQIRYEKLTKDLEESKMRTDDLYSQWLSISTTTECKEVNIPQIKLRNSLLSQYKRDMDDIFAEIEKKQEEAKAQAAAEKEAKEREAKEKESIIKEKEILRHILQSMLRAQIAVTKHTTFFDAFLFNGDAESREIIKKIIEILDEGFENEAFDNKLNTLFLHILQTKPLLNNKQTNLIDTALAEIEKVKLCVYDKSIEKAEMAKKIEEADICIYDKSRSVILKTQHILTMAKHRCNFERYLTFVDGQFKKYRKKCGDRRKDQVTFIETKIKAHLNLQNPTLLKNGLSQFIDLRKFLKTELGFLISTKELRDVNEILESYGRHSELHKTLLRLLKELNKAIVEMTPDQPNPGRRP